MPTSGAGHGLAAGLAIVRALARFDPYDGSGYCFFCGARRRKEHDAICLWYRAEGWVQRRRFGGDAEDADDL